MNIRRIIKEEINDFDWAEDIDSMDIHMASNKKMKYNPILTDEIFNEVKGLVTQIWETYDNTFGYVDEKMSIVNSLPQEWDSIILMIRMFHVHLQMKILENLSKETSDAIKLEMYDRGWTSLDF